MAGLKECEWCGDDFVFEHNREVYCGEECREAGYNFKRRMRRRKKPGDKIKDCAYCGQPFIYEHNREIYCSPRCQKHGYQDKDNERHKKYYRLYKWIKPRNLGTVSLGSKPDPDPDKEQEKIEKERQRMGLTNKMFSTSAGTLSLFLQGLFDSRVDNGLLLMCLLYFLGVVMVIPAIKLGCWWLLDVVEHYIIHH